MRGPGGGTIFVHTVPHRLYLSILFNSIVSATPLCISGVFVNFRQPPSTGLFLQLSQATLFCNSLPKCSLPGSSDITPSYLNQTVFCLDLMRTVVNGQHQFNAVMGLRKRLPSHTYGLNLKALCLRDRVSLWDWFAFVHLFEHDLIRPLRALD